MTEAKLYQLLQDHYQKGLPLVAYRKPIKTRLEGQLNLLLQQNDLLYYIKDYEESGFVFAPFDSSKKAILIPMEKSDSYTGVQTTREEASESASHLIEQKSKLERQKHIKIVEEAILELNKEQLEKVVLSRKEEVPLSQLHPLKVFHSLLQNYPDAFVFCWFHPKVGLWLGATPEKLLKIEGGLFKTMALAGTQKFKGNLDVAWGEKEVQEQHYVTEEILSNLRAFASEILTSEVHTTRAGNLLHLCTEIRGKLKPTQDKVARHIQLKDILTSLHPTPAVCGLPKSKALAFISKVENFDREYYTGYLGELNLQQRRSRSSSRRNTENLAYRSLKKVTDLYVNLRSMKMEQDRAVLFIGGGITKDSIAPAEWEETVAKAQTMKRVLYNS